MSVRASTWVAVIVGLAALTACGDDKPNSRTDVDEDKIEVGIEGMHVEAFPDRYPNVAWKCAGRNGLYSTTDRKLYIVVNDPNCSETGRDDTVVIGDDITTTTEVTATTEVEG